MLASFLGVLPILTPALCALALAHSKLDAKLGYIVRPSLKKGGGGGGEGRVGGEGGGGKGERENNNKNKGKVTLVKKWGGGGEISIN
jgi:hypothetical protein